MFNNSFNTVSNIQFGSYQLKDVWWNVQSFNIPGISFNPPQVSPRAGAFVNIAADSVNFDDLSLKVILDEQFLVYDSLYAYFIENLNVETGTFEKYGQFDIWVQVYDNNGNPIRKFNFYNCRLKDFGGVIQESTDREDSNNYIDISFVFDYMDYNNCFVKLHKPDDCDLKYNPKYTKGKG